MTEKPLTLHNILSTFIISDITVKEAKPFKLVNNNGIQDLQIKQ